MTLAWSLSNKFGIQRDATVWHAGHINDVLEVSTTSVLVASDTGGVWLLSAGNGLSLSKDWDAPNTMALCHGLDGPNHYYSGGSTPDGHGALYQTDIHQAIPLWSPWLPISLPPELGAIQQLIIDRRRRVLVLATSRGLWFSQIPVLGSNVLFNWILAAGVSANDGFMGLALSGNDTVLSATSGNIYYGGWIGDMLTMQPSQITGMQRDQMTWVILATASPPSPQAYASVCKPDNAFIGILSSDDRGASWSSRRAINEATGVLIEEHNQLGYTGAIAVPPNQPNTLILGYTAGPYISRDGGDHFKATTRSLTHDDKHSYRFTARGRLYEANDGGVTYSDDLGITFHTEFNRYLANLQFGQHSASYQVPGLIGGGLQDNSNVYCLRDSNGNATPWRVVVFPPYLDFDGDGMIFLRTGDVLYAYGNHIQLARWDASRLVTNGSFIPIGIPHAGVTRSGDDLRFDAWTVVSDPAWRDSAGKLMFCVVSSGKDIYGLFADDNGSNKHWNYLVTLPITINPDAFVSAVSSGSGRKILAGISGAGQIWVLDMERGASVAPCTGLPDSRQGYVRHIIVQSDGPGLEAFAVWNDGSIGSVYHTTDFVTFTRIGIGLPGTPMYGFATDWTVSPKTLFTTTQDQVFVSSDNGQTWSQQSNGLPRSAYCGELAFVVHPDHSKLLHLSTWGWSTWVARIN